MDAYACLPFAAGAARKTYATWPVWSGSTTKEVPFKPMSRKAAWRLVRRAEDFDRQTRRKGCHGGIIGHLGLLVLRTIVSFLNYESGRLYPSYETIARKTNVCQRTVATKIAQLRDLGILNWKRRCQSSWRDGRHVLEQTSNAYALLPETQWRGYRPPEPPPPDPGTWGDPKRVPSVLEEAAAETDPRRKLQALELAEPRTLEASLANLGNAVAGRKVDPVAALGGMTEEEWLAGHAEIALQLELEQARQAELRAAEAEAAQDALARVRAGAEARRLKGDLATKV
jgi:hypothetical protein